MHLNQGGTSGLLYFRSTRSTKKYQEVPKSTKKYKKYREVRKKYQRSTLYSFDFYPQIEQKCSVILVFGIEFLTLRNNKRPLFCFGNRSTKKDEEVRRSTKKHREVRRSTEKYREVQRSTRSTEVCLFPLGLAPDSSNSPMDSPRNMFQMFHSRSKCNSTSSIQWYNQIFITQTIVLKKARY